MQVILYYYIAIYKYTTADEYTILIYCKIIIIFFFLNCIKIVIKIIIKYKLLIWNI